MFSTITPQAAAPLAQDDIDQQELAERRRLARNVIIGRARARLSQAALAQRSGVTRATVSNIERAFGSAQIGTVFRIASALGTSAAALFTDAVPSRVREEDLAGLAARGHDGAIDAHDLVAAVNEAYRDTPEALARYSRAGRPSAAHVHELETVS